MQLLADAFVEALRSHPGLFFILTAGAGLVIDGVFDLMRRGNN